MPMREASSKKQRMIWTYLVMTVCLVVLAGIEACAQSSRSSTGILLKPPPTTMLSGQACSVGALNLRFATGNDDLRGGKNNLSIEVHFSNGDMQTVANVNRGAGWPNHSVNSVSIHLNHPVNPSDIRQIRLIHSAQGGYNAPSARQASAMATPVGPALAPIYAAEGAQTEDNWDMTEFQAFGIGTGIDVPIASFGAHRFTGSNPSLDVNAQSGVGCPMPNQVKKISFKFSTTDDDLRGGNDNLNVTILFANGSSQTESNVNHSQNWPNGSTKDTEILLSNAVTVDQIRAIRLETTFTGGSGGDNWNMGSMQADAFLVNGSHHTIAKSGFHRFSADGTGPNAKQISITAHAIN
jgi:hypothetical protein